MEDNNKEIFLLEGEDIFDGNLSDAIAVMYWLVYLAGGEVAFPVDEEFWDTHYPEDARLVLRKKEGQLILAAEQKVWTSNPGSFD